VSSPVGATAAALALVLAGLLTPAALLPPSVRTAPATMPAGSNGSAVANFSEVVNRIVVLLGVSGGGLLAIVWARVALSWFSNDVTKKIQAKDRARDALVGTLIFAAALSGLIWGLARWVLTGA
jgi:hypothetical protein